MKIKKYLALALVVVMMVTTLVVACAQPTPSPAPAPTPAPAPAPTPAPAPEPEQIVLKTISWGDPVRVGREIGMWWFRDRVYAQSEGRIRVDIVGGGEVIPYDEAFTALRENVVDVLWSWSGMHATELPEVAIIDLAPLAEDGTVQPEVMDYMVKVYERANVRYLGRMVQFNPFHIWTNKKINSLKELANLKIATSSGKWHLMFLEGLGTSPLNMKMAEIYTALERNLADGCAYTSIAHTVGIHEVVDYMIFPPYKTSSNTSAYMNLDVWSKLPKDLQDVVTEVMLTIQRDGLLRDQGLTQRDYNVFKNAGVEFLDFSLTADADWYSSIYYLNMWDTLATEVSPEVAQEIARIVKDAGGVTP